MTILQAIGMAFAFFLLTLGFMGPSMAAVIQGI